jgi:hypothetical protein
VITLIRQRLLAITATTSSTPQYGQGLLSGEQSAMSSGGNGSLAGTHCASLPGSDAAHS